MEDESNAIVVNDEDEDDMSELREIESNQAINMINRILNHKHTNGDESLLFGYTDIKSSKVSKHSDIIVRLNPNHALYKDFDIDKKNMLDSINKSLSRLNKKLTSAPKTVKKGKNGRLTTSSSLFPKDFRDARIQNIKLVEARDLSSILQAFEEQGTNNSMNVCVDPILYGWSLNQKNIFFVNCLLIWLL